jgi:hypothetical protein
VLAARAAMGVFNAAYNDWGDEGAAALGALMQRSLADFHQIFEPTSPASISQV